jgi:hypothetical protein
MSEKVNYDYLVAIVKDAIFSQCDSTFYKDDFDDSVRLPEMFGKEIEKFAERIATEIHGKL